MLAHMTQDRIGIASAAIQQKPQQSAAVRSTDSHRLHLLPQPRHGIQQRVVQNRLMGVGAERGGSAHHRQVSAPQALAQQIKGLAMLAPEPSKHGVMVLLVE